MDGKGKGREESYYRLVEFLLDLSFLFVGLLHHASMQTFPFVQLVLSTVGLYYISNILFIFICVQLPKASNETHDTRAAPLFYACYCINHLEKRPSVNY